MNWKRFFCTDRVNSHGESETPAPQVLRSEYSRDWDRVIFSHGFRKLHDKTQVFPLSPNDLVHSRMTHSLEVASVGRSLGCGVGQLLAKEKLLPDGVDARDVGDIVAAACLAHDIGNPPFGHSGEDAIARFFEHFLTDEMVSALKLTETQVHDLTKFEGNAQGFRLLAKRELDRTGVRLTATTFAAFMKYPRLSVKVREGLPEAAYRKKFGVFQSETAVLHGVATASGMFPDPALGGNGYVRHPLAWLVEAADDICYRVLDLEDGVRLRLIPESEGKSALVRLISTCGDKQESDSQPIGRLRASAIHALIGVANEQFAANHVSIADGTHTRSLLDCDTRSQTSLEVLKKLVQKHCYNAREVLEIELAGYTVLDALLTKIVSATLSVRAVNDAALKECVSAWSKDHGRRLATGREAKKVLEVCNLAGDVVKNSAYEALLEITDYVSGMTDSFAVRVYRHLEGIALPNQE